MNVWMNWKDPEVSKVFWFPDMYSLSKLLVFISNMIYPWMIENMSLIRLTNRIWIWEKLAKSYLKLLDGHQLLEVSVSQTRRTLFKIKHSIWANLIKIIHSDFERYFCQSHRLATVDSEFLSQRVIGNQGIFLCHENKNRWFHTADVIAENFHEWSPSFRWREEKNCWKTNSKINGKSTGGTV